MNIKTKFKRKQFIVKVKLSRSIKIFPLYYSIQTSQSIAGLLELLDNHRNVLSFRGPMCIRLSQRLEHLMSKDEFFLILQQTVDTIERLKQLELPYENLYFDPNNVFYHTVTKQVFFIYLPTEKPVNKVSVIDFIKSIIFSVTPPVNSDTNYLMELIDFFNKKNEYSIKEIKQEIYRLKSILISSEQNSQSQNGIYHNLTSDADDEKTDILFNDDQTNLLFTRENSDSPDEESTVLLSQEGEQTNIVSDHPEAHPPCFPSLVRKLTNEKIYINKPVFRIGKEESCVDYVVFNNAAISRSHIDIIIRDNRYFAFDLRSKNKSYINNRVLPAEHEVEIFDGDILKLANEEFIFQV